MEKLRPESCDFYEANKEHVDYEITTGRNEEAR